MSLSRRERREYAKKLGLLSGKESYHTMIGRFRRSSEAGDFLHTHHLQEIKNSQIESKSPDVNSTNQEDSGENLNPYGFLGKR